MSINSNLGIGVTMFLRDEFSGPAAKIKAAQLGMKKSMDELYNDQLRYTRNLSAGIAMMGAGALAGLGKAIKKGAEFQYQMEFTGIVTGATIEQQKYMVKEAQKMASQYTFSSDQIVAGMKEMGKAGMGVEETLSNIRAATALAISTDFDLAASTDMMISVMKQWNLPFSESAKIANMLSYAVNASVIDMPDLAEAMKYAGSTAIDTGVKIEEVTAMIMALGQAGMKGSMAGVAVENALRYMGRAIGKYGTGQQKQALADLGIGLEDVSDAAGNMRPMVEVFGAIKKSMDQAFGPDMGIEKQNILNAIFGVRGKRSASLLLRMMDQYKGFVKDVSKQPGDQTGFAFITTNTLMDELWAKIKQLGGAWKNVGQSLAKSVEPIARVILGILREVGNVMNWLISRPLFGKFLAGGIMGFLTIKTVSLAYKAVVAGLTLMHRQLTGSMATMAGVTVAGYTSMSNAARGFAYTAANAGTTAKLAAMGMFGGGKSAIKVNAAGRYVRAKGIGSFVSGAVAARYAQRFGAGKLATWAAGKMGGSILTGLLGKIVGILGGPWGMAIAFGLPGLINLLIPLFRGHKKSVDDNTLALKEDKSAMVSRPDEKQRYIQAVEFINANRGRIGAMKELGDISSSVRPDENFTGLLIQLLEQITQQGNNPTTVILNVDSKQVMKSIIPTRGTFIRQ